MEIIEVSIMLILTFVLFSWLGMAVQVIDYMLFKKNNKESMIIKFVGVIWFTLLAPFLYYNILKTKEVNKK